MQVRELSIAGAFEVTPLQRGDDRGVFFEWYRFDTLSEHVGHALYLRQANTSVSQAGVVRGIHFADVPPSQAKYVTLSAGSAIDYIIDLRVGSPTFGQWDSVLLDTIDRRAVYIAEGLGHAFLSLEDGTTVSYLVSEVYNPVAEKGISPLDPEIGLTFPVAAGDLRFSPKDEIAPTLQQALEQGLLPTWANASAHYAMLDNQGK